MIGSGYYVCNCGESELYARQEPPRGVRCELCGSTLKHEREPVTDIDLYDPEEQRLVGDRARKIVATVIMIAATLAAMALLGLFGR